MRFVASSVRGPSHVREGRPCQDAWLAVANSNASFAAVCDGLGSREHSHEGSKAAVRAARDAWRLWKRSPVGTVEDFIRLLEAAWRIRLGTVPMEDAATTCLVYAEDGHGRALQAQLGDGIIVRLGQTGEVITNASADAEFGLTQALGTPHSLNDWSLRIGVPIRPGEALLLATDGVSEDLLPERLPNLVSWVRDDIGERPAPGRALAQELRNWPVPGHLDDKTMCVLWRH